MKKWILAALSIVAIVIAVIYFLLPAPSSIGGRISIRSSADGVYRTMAEQDKWDSLGAGNFNIKKLLVNTIVLGSNTSEDTSVIKLLLIPLDNDSVDIAWTAQIPDVSGLLSKWSRNRNAAKTRAAISNTLENFRLYLEDDKNLYGIHITETSNYDTLLIATRFTQKEYPSIPEIYQHLEKLQSTAQELNAASTGYPMLNVTKTDSGSYRCMVALPINKVVEGKGDVFFLRMVPGRFLTADVIGGPYTLLRANEMLQLYFKDFKRLSMAIPFEYMITNRMTEPDTSKWVSKIYGPVF